MPVQVGAGAAVLARGLCHALVLVLIALLPGPALRTCAVKSPIGCPEIPLRLAGAVVSTRVSHRASQRADVIVAKLAGEADWASAVEVSAAVRPGTLAAVHARAGSADVGAAVQTEPARLAIARVSIFIVSRDALAVVSARVERDTGFDVTVIAAESGFTDTRVLVGIVSTQARPV